MDIQLAGESQDAIELVISFAVPAVVLLACLIVVTLLGKAAWASVQFQAGKVRQYVDEPTDTIIVAVDGVGEWLLHRKLDEALISKLMTATIDAITGTQPPREVSIGDTAK